MGILWNEKAWAFQRFVKQVATSMEEGKALWGAIENMHIFKGGEQLETSSFRWNAEVIASVTGGSYLDYYCAAEDADFFNTYSSEAKERVLKRIADLGYELREMEIDTEEITERLSK